MVVRQFVNSVFTSNSYVVHDSATAIIIDMGDFEPVKEYIDNNNLDVEALFITHTHYDHIYGVRKFLPAFPHAPIYTSVFGKEAYGKPNWNFSRYHGDEMAIESDRIRTLAGGDALNVLNCHKLEALATPGHDKSCLSFRLDNMLFTGDSYIPGVKVIASFPNSNKADAGFWYSKLQAMSPLYDIYPGHGEPQPLNQLTK